MSKTMPCSCMAPFASAPVLRGANRRGGELVLILDLCRALRFGVTIRDGDVRGTRTRSIYGIMYRNVYESDIERYSSPHGCCMSGSSSRRGLARIYRTTSTSHIRASRHPGRCLRHAIRTTRRVYHRDHSCSMIYPGWKLRSQTLGTSGQASLQLLPECSPDPPQTRASALSMMLCQRRIAYQDFY